METIHAIHAKKIIHRDLKPENILLRDKSNDQDIVLADFGLATHIDESRN